MSLEVNGAPKSNGTPRKSPNGTPLHSRQPSYAASKGKLAAHFIGANNLDAAPPSKVKDFVQDHDGHTVITNVSIAAAAARWTSGLTRAGADCQQWHCGGQGDPLGAEMGV